MKKTIYRLFKKMFNKKIEKEFDIEKFLITELKKDKDFILVVSGSFISKEEAKKLTKLIKEKGYNPIPVWIRGGNINEAIKIIELCKKQQPKFSA